MTASRSPVQPRRMSGSLTASCGQMCSLGQHSKKFTPEQVAQIHGWYEMGLPYVTIQRRALEFPGVSYVDIKSVRTHHDRHLSPAKVGGRAKQVDSINVLKTVIAEGFENSGRWRPTLADTMRAIQLLNQVEGSTKSADVQAIEDVINAAASGDWSGIDVEDDEGKAADTSGAAGTADELGRDYEG